MLLNQQCCTLEQAKKLCLLGVKQNAIGMWEWRTKPEPFWHLGIPCCAPHSWALVVDECAAFNVAELGLMLPPEINIASAAVWKVEKIATLPDQPWHVSFMTDHVTRISFNLYPTEAQAKADLLICMIENEVVTVDECNTRLANTSLPHGF